jgi:hypothetical protein
MSVIPKSIFPERSDSAIFIGVMRIKWKIKMIDLVIRCFKTIFIPIKIEKQFLLYVVLELLRRTIMQKRGEKCVLV